MDILWYNYDLSDPRDITKCVKQIERICRASLEYDEWQRGCKYKDSSDCPVCDDNYYDNNSKCESHHHPKTLYDIVEEILEEHLENNDLDETTGILVVQEVMDLHLFKKVSYLNLCQHCHKKYHAGHPDVKHKIDLIFSRRIQAEMDKDVVEKDDEITVGTFESLDRNLITSSASPIDKTSTRDSKTEFEKNHLTDFKEVKTIEVETSTDFVTINLEDI